jgi:hypothetical protein
MSEELGKIEKPPIDEFKKGRKLYFIPLVYEGTKAEAEFLEKFNQYWEQLEIQIGELEIKLGKVSKIYHEFISASGEEAVKSVKGLSDKSWQIITNRLEKGAQFEPTEDEKLLTELMDWTRCLAIGLQNQEVLTKVYEFYTAAGKNRNEHIARQIDDTLKTDEIGILFMREGHQVQFSSDIQVFYVAPPALDEIKRWLRDQEVKGQEGK